MSGSRRVERRAGAPSAGAPSAEAREPQGASSAADPSRDVGRAPQPHAPKPPSQAQRRGGQAQGRGGQAQGRGGQPADSAAGRESQAGAPAGTSPKRGSKRRRRRRGGGNRLPERTIVFVGPMAAGKTSLGRRVAKELGIPFVDSDVVFVRKYGAIADFFEANGEPEFRRLEEEIIAAELAQPGKRILALGGGAVLSDATRALLSDYPTILLMTTQEAVLRTANLSRRPLLRNDPSSWGRILEERKPLYREVSDITFRTDRAGKEQLSRRVVEWVRAYARREYLAAQAAQRGAAGAPEPKAADAPEPKAADANSAVPPNTVGKDQE